MFHLDYSPLNSGVLPLRVIEKAMSELAGITVR